MLPRPRATGPVASLLSRSRIESGVVSTEVGPAADRIATLQYSSACCHQSRGPGPLLIFSAREENRHRLPATDLGRLPPVALRQRAPASRNAGVRWRAPPLVVVKLCLFVSDPKHWNRASSLSFRSRRLRWRHRSAAVRRELRRAKTQHEFPGRHSRGTILGDAFTRAVGSVHDRVASSIERPLDTLADAQAA